jgi:hypothetical protein
MGINNVNNSNSVNMQPIKFTKKEVSEGFTPKPQPVMGAVDPFYSAPIKGDLNSLKNTNWGPPSPPAQGAERFKGTVFSQSNNIVITNDAISENLEMLKGSSWGGVIVGGGVQENPDISARDIQNNLEMLKQSDVPYPPTPGIQGNYSNVDQLGGY